MNKCAKCGREVTGRMASPGMYRASDLAAMQQQVMNNVFGFFCPTCQKGFCKFCAMEAAKKAGKGGYTCPDCLSLIGEHPWE